MVVEAGVVAGYMIAWVARKARRAGGGVDGEIDAVIDAGLEKLHSAVATKLGGHPVLEDLADEASTGEGRVSELTRQQVELAITAAARKDEEFGRAVTGLVEQVRAAERECGVSVMAGRNSRVVIGDAHVQASGGGVAFGQVAGDVQVNRGIAGERPDPTEPGRSRP